MSLFKQLFHSLFGKREEAPEAPVAKASTAAPKETSAPGTTIRYHPELLGKLTDEHQLLLRLFGETSDAANRGDMASAAERLDTFHVALQDHLLTENISLYVYLEHLFADDARSHALIHEFRHEMDGISKVVLAFLGKYRQLATQPELAGTFPDELAAVGKVLLGRIEREEGTLYPLYTR